MSSTLINRAVLRDGDWICRRGAAFWPSQLIMRVTAGDRWEVPVDAWSHDALIIHDHGHPAIGDCLMGRTCQLTTIYEWEQDCIHHGSKILVLRPAGATEADGRAAAAWWMENCHHREYDKVAIGRLFLKRLFGDRFPGCGKETHFYCSEGNGNAWRKGPRIPFYTVGIERDSPGASWRAWKANRLVEVADALTAEGMKYRIGGLRA